ncbi:FMP52 [Candida margitis]|uniref:FMP52 n=1 Tax=Candida margitis TaxID=1775924 RepID=UPI0022275BDB|nr:FMP52 [Candida margitis]KAI5968652.1 FMP52 [Candida margitis]
MSELFVLGSTGLVGGFVIKTGLQAKQWTKITTLTRREPQFATEEKIDAIVNTDLDEWPNIIKDVKPTPFAFISAFGTTRAAAGSAENFKKIDYGTNLDAARAAKESGAKACILVSAFGASTKSPFFYFRTKAHLEEAIIALDFDYTIILRPGMLIGERDGKSDWAHKLAKLTQNAVFSPVFRSIHASDVGKIAVHFANRAKQGDMREKVKIVDGGELLELVASEKIE